MRRALSLILVLFFALGPFAASLQSEDARLPPCCRRNGTHHCAMSDAMIARMVQQSQGKPILTAPSHCPLYPHGNAATLAPTQALTQAPTALPTLRAQAHLPVPHRAAALSGRLRSHSGLSPPAFKNC